MPYCRLVFTLPHEINALAAVHARWVYDTLMQCAAATLTEFAANPRWLGGVGAFTLVLHTWTQDLRRHLHVHALMACGALRPGADVEGAASWVSPKRALNFLFPVHALSRVFRAKFMQALGQAVSAGALPRDPADTALARHLRMQAMRRHDWVVYAKTPLAGPAAVLDYLSRYTHRTAIGNERLVGIQGDKVLLRVRADDAVGKRTVALEGTQLIGRFLQHVLPPGFKRIRHYGLLAPAAKTKRLALVRQLLLMPAANPRSREDAQAFMRRVAQLEINGCPHCKVGRWGLVGQRGADRAAIAATIPAACRGPPWSAQALPYAAELGSASLAALRTRAPVCPKRPFDAPIYDAASTAHGHRGVQVSMSGMANSVKRASALPIPSAETYTAQFHRHTTFTAAVQSNKVYLTPCGTSALVHRRLGVR